MTDFGLVPTLLVLLVALGSLWVDGHTHTVILLLAAGLYVDPYPYLLFALYLVVTSVCLNRESAVWAHLFRLFLRHEIIEEAADDERYKGGKAIFAPTPHGPGAFGTIKTFVVPGYPSAYARTRMVTSRVMLDAPLVGRVCRALGCVDATRPAMEAVLAADEALVVIPEGHWGQTTALHGRTQERNARSVSTGFLKLAWETKVPVYPVYHAGETHAAGWIARWAPAKRLFLWVLAHWSERYAERLRQTRHLDDAETRDRLLGHVPAPAPRGVRASITTHIGAKIDPLKHEDDKSFYDCYFDALRRLTLSS